MDFRLYLLQRLSAMIMAPLVLVHIGMMIYAVQDGLSAEEILSRIRGAWGWAVFYGLFVVAAAVHAAIGLRVIVSEWCGVTGLTLTGFAWATFFGLLSTGAYAVVAVTVAP